MDTSASMLQQLKLSQEAAVRFLESIPRARDLVTIFFDDDIRLSRYNSENQQGLFERIADAKGGGDTALYDAISVYLSRVQDSSGRKVLVLFTDGEDTRSALALGECLQLIRSSGVTIYPIAFTSGLPARQRARPSSKSVLEQMAELTGARCSPRARRRTSPGSTSASWRSCRRNTSSATSPTTPRATASSGASRWTCPERACA